MRTTESESSCRFRQTCHFYTITGKNDYSIHLKELYCIKWPEQCKIHQSRSAGRLVAITLWPTGKLSLGS
jgi:hypothetical protein